MLDIVKLSPDWPVSSSKLAKAVFSLLKKEGLIEKGEKATLALSNDAHLHQLNRDFRQIDKTTNVLSFLQASPFLGDIAISFETISHEAIEQEKTFEAHFSHMVLHGILHLLDYDHMSEEDQSEMETLEIELLAKLGFENPYETL